MSNDIAARRDKACRKLMAQVRVITSKEGNSPSGLHAIKLALVRLANQTELFPPADFALPVSEGRTHPLVVEDNDGHGLYLTVHLPGKEAAPHDHGVWCVNAAVSGHERHVLFRRAEDDTLIEIGAITVAPGTGMAMADRDIHSTLVIGDEPAFGLALYGYALARFPSVVWYHTDLSAVRASPSRRMPVSA